MLTKEVGDVVGAECAGGVSFAESPRYRIRSIFPNQCEEFADLSSQRTIRIGQTPEIGFAGGTEQGNQALLSHRALCRRELGE